MKLVKKQQELDKANARVREMQSVIKDSKQQVSRGAAQMQ